jgi:transposase
MPAPGEYLADVTEGITRVEDLPKAKVLPCSRNYKGRKCPRCGTRASRLRRVERLLHDLGDLVSGHPHDMHLTYSQHHCSRCGHYFNANTSDLALPGSHYTHRVVTVAVRLVVEDGLPYRAASWHLWRDHRVFVPYATLQNWVEASGKKSGRADGGGLPHVGSR